MDRHEALNVLKEIVALKIIQPSLVSIEENGDGTFDIVLKGDCDIRELKEFTATKDLTIESDKENCLYKIREP